MADSEMSDQQQMETWRRRIDEIDQMLIRLFNERTQCAIEIGHIKKRLSRSVKRR